MDIIAAKDDISIRKLRFGRKIVLIIGIMLVISLIAGIMVNVIIGNIWHYSGFLIFLSLAILLLSIRNYQFIKQLSKPEFQETSIYNKKFQWFIYIVYLLFTLFIFIFPSSNVKDIVSPMPQFWQALSFTFIIFVLSTMLLFINIWIPAWNREREIVKSDNYQMREGRKNITILEFQSNPILNKEQADLNEIKTLLENLKQYMDHIRYNQYILISRKDILGIKIILARIGFISTIFIIFVSIIRMIYIFFN